MRGLGICLCLLLEIVVWVDADREECQDDNNSCRRIGHKHPLSRCYSKEGKCCATCTRLRLPIPGCPYGDQESWCDSIGQERPVSVCYTDGATCCQTCHRLHSGTPDCPYGDKPSTLCNGIGRMFELSICYDEESNCCDTCRRFQKPNPDCRYGDRDIWCSMMTRESCLDPNNKARCCSTCEVLLATTTPPTTTTTTPPTTTTTTSTTPPTVRTTTTPSDNKPPNTTSTLQPRSNGSAPATYTGSPGRPVENTSTVNHGQPQSSSTISTPVSHSTLISANVNFTVAPYVNSDPSANVKNVTLEDSHSNSSDSDYSENSANETVPCHPDVIVHKIRHNKDGRHNSRRHSKDVLCANVTSDINTSNLTLPQPRNNNITTNISTGYVNQDNVTSNYTSDDVTQTNNLESDGEDPYPDKNHIGDKDNADPDKDISGKVDYLGEHRPILSGSDVVYPCGLLTALVLCVLF